MVKLNLPEFDFKVFKQDDKFWIYDIIRKKNVVLTPEEWVRQHFIHYLINHLHYPKNLIKIEGGLKYNQLQKRSDIVVFNRRGEPWMIVECKSAAMEINESTVRQVSMYNHSLKSKYVVLTNGLKHYCALMDFEKQGYEILTALPLYEQDSEL